MIKSHKIVCYHLFYFIHRLYNILQKIKKKYINILKNDIILTILEKGVVIVMCTLLIKILY